MKTTAILAFRWSDGFLRLRQWLGQMRAGKNPPLQTTCLLALVIAVAGCSSLKSAYYPGEKVVLTNGFLAVESDWMLCDKGVYHVHCTESNTLVVAAMEWDNKKGDYATESFEVVLSELDDQLFLSIQCNEDGKDQLYTILRVVVPATDKESPDTAILFNVDSDKLKADAKANKINARKTNCGYGSCDYALEGTKQEQDTYFRSNPNGLWDLDNAVILKRVAQRNGD
ncbi:hypothetical protein [Pontiella desulfatans]|nr:hypothetical protein [Pontiella desulfatans]